MYTLVFGAHIMMHLAGRRPIRLHSLILPAVFALVWPAYGEAIPSGMQQPTGSPVGVTESGAENMVGISSIPRQAWGSPPSSFPVSGAGARAVNDSHKDLTAFFVIGMIVNVLLIVLFLIWAVGQWRKTKK